MLGPAALYVTGLWKLIILVITLVNLRTEILRFALMPMRLLLLQRLSRHRTVDVVLLSRRNLWWGPFAFYKAMELRVLRNPWTTVGSMRSDRRLKPLLGLHRPAGTVSTY